MEPKKLELPLPLSLQETQMIVACLLQFKAADVFDLAVKMKQHEKAILAAEQN